jgi:TolB protein
MIAFVGSGDGGESEIFVANANGTEIRQVTSAGGATMPAWSPDGETIAFTAPDRGGTENVFLFDFATGVASQLTFEEKFAFNPEFTPDGADVVFSSRRGNGDDVLVVPVAGGTPNFLVSEAGFDAGDGAVSPDGSHLSFAFGPNAGGALGRWLADASGSDRRQIADGATFPSATWSPDGNRLAYWSFPSETVFVYDVASGEARDVADGAWPTWLNAHTLIVEVHAGL